MPSPRRRASEQQRNIKMKLNDPSSCHLGFGFLGFLLNVQPMYTVVKVDVAMAPC